MSTPVNNDPITAPDEGWYVRALENGPRYAQNLENADAQIALLRERFDQEVAPLLAYRDLQARMVAESDKVTSLYLGKPIKVETVASTTHVSSPVTGRHAAVYPVTAPRVSPAVYMFSGDINGGIDTPFGSLAQGWSLPEAMENALNWVLELC